MTAEEAEAAANAASTTEQNTLSSNFYDALYTGVNGSSSDRPQ